jgi:hypothetical protein
MRKTTSKIISPGLQSHRLTSTLKHYRRNRKDSTKETEPVKPTEEAVDRLNIIGKTYPFCVYYRPQVNDPL